jgi:plasmid stabilization system protein ParE
LKYRLTSAAEKEFADAAQYLLDASPQAALDFVEVVSSAIEEIAENPHRYAVHARGIHVRRTQVHPYSIFYEIKPDHVLILSISHDAREPEHWSDRE